MDAVAQRPEADPASREYDIAVANLQAAVGLPGAENLDIPRCLNWLDDAARRVSLATLRCAHQFRIRPHEFHDSPAYFCMLVLATVVYRDLGIRYNSARIRPPDANELNHYEPDYFDSRDYFIHGMIGGPGGTCASMPVLYVALGRRLGYPLKLARAKCHLFVRWDDPRGERLNVEATCAGLLTYPDDHYKQWPLPMTSAESQSTYWLHSLRPQEEVAAFRAGRALCLWTHGHWADALRETGVAGRLTPGSLFCLWQVKHLYKRYRTIMATKTCEEIGRIGLSRQEEIALQKCIVRVHEGRLREGLPGFDLAEFGVYPKPLAQRPWPALTTALLTPAAATKPEQARCAC